MAAASANVQLATAGRAKLPVLVLEGEILYAGAYAVMGTRSHGTAGNRGRAFAGADNTKGVLPLGFVDQQKTGVEASGIDASINVQGHVVRNLTITDDAGTIADQGRLVYLEDDQTFTLTRPTTQGFPIGIVTRFVAVNTFDVYFFSLGEIVAISMAGAGRQTWHIGTIVAEIGATTADLLTGIVCPYHGYIVDYYLICASAPADVDVAGTVNLEVGATNLSFATTDPTIAAADTVGLKISGTGALTPTAIHEGDLIDVEGTFSAAGTVGDGIYNVYVDIRPEPGS